MISTYFPRTWDNSHPRKYPHFPLSLYESFLALNTVRLGWSKSFSCLTFCSWSSSAFRLKCKRICICQNCLTWLSYYVSLNRCQCLESDYLRRVLVLIGMLSLLLANDLYCLTFSDFSGSELHLWVLSKWVLELLLCSLIILPASGSGKDLSYIMWTSHPWDCQLTLVWLSACAV